MEICPLIPIGGGIAGMVGVGALLAIKASSAEAVHHGDDALIACAVAGLFA